MTGKDTSARRGAAQQPAFGLTAVRELLEEMKSTPPDSGRGTKYWGARLERALAATSAPEQQPAAGEVVSQPKGHLHPDVRALWRRYIDAVESTEEFCAVEELAELASRNLTAPAASEPLQMRLPCPECSRLHIDEGEFATKSHHTHACQHCGHVWRPAVAATVGVQFLPGFKNEPAPAPAQKQRSVDGLVESIRNGNDFDNAALDELAALARGREVSQ